jgi:hypothetical protein
LWDQKEGLIKFTGVVGGAGVVILPLFLASGLLVVVVCCCLRLFDPLDDFFCTPFLRVLHELRK